MEKSDWCDIVPLFCAAYKVETLTTETLYDTIRQPRLDGHLLEQGQPERSLTPGKVQIVYGHVPTMQRHIDDRKESPGRIKFLSLLQGGCLVINTALLLVDLFWLPAIITGITGFLQIALARRRKAAHLCAAVNLVVSLLASAFHAYVLAMLMQKHPAKELFTEHLFGRFPSGLVHLFGLVLNLAGLVAGVLCLRQSHQLDHFDPYQSSPEDSIVELARVRTCESIVLRSTGKLSTISRHHLAEAGKEGRSTHAHVFAPNPIHGVSVNRHTSGV